MGYYIGVGLLAQRLEQRTHKIVRYVGKPHNGCFQIQGNLSRKIRQS